MHTFWNGTTTRYDTHMDMMFLLFNCTVLTLVLGLPGNLWVCWIVFRTKSLQTCSNMLLVSLAAIYFLKCSVSTPLRLFSLLHYGKESQLSVSEHFWGWLNVPTSASFTAPQGFLASGFCPLLSSPAHCFCTGQ